MAEEEGWSTSRDNTEDRAGVYPRGKKLECPRCRVGGAMIAAAEAEAPPCMRPTKC